MGKSVSGKHHVDRTFYFLNIPYLDYFILKIIVKKYDEYQLSDLKKKYQQEHKTLPSNALWSQALGRLRSKCLIETYRKEQIYITHFSSATRIKLEECFNKLRELDELISVKTVLRESGVTNEGKQ